MRRGHPSPLRVGAGCLAAAGAASAPTILLGPAVILALPVGFVIASLHMLLIGLPAYLVMRRYWAIDWGHAVLAGAVIGAAPITLWAWASWGGDGGPIFSGWTLVLALLGMLGGAAFRAVIGPPRERMADRAAASVFE